MTALLKFLRRNFLVAFVAAGGVLSAFLMYGLARYWDEQGAHRLVESAAEAQTNAVEERLLAIIEELRTLRGGVDAAGATLPSQFLQMAAPMFDQYPMLYGLGWAPRRQGGAGEQYIFAMHKLRPIGAALLPADLNDQAQPRAAIAHARDTGAVTVSRQLTLEPDPLRGVLLILPVYRPGLPLDTVERRRTALLGMMVAMIDVESLFEDTVARLFWDQLDFVVREGGPDGDILHVHAPRLPNQPSPQPAKIEAGPLIEVTWLRAGNQTWTLTHAPSPGFLAEHISQRPLAVLLLGLLLMAVATAYVRLLQRRHLQVESLVATQTASLRKSEARAHELAGELREHRDHLAELVAAQTADLVMAKEAAERANQAKSEFLTKMSHELRTPMHAILSFAAIGLMKADQVSPEKLRGYFQNIRVSCERLLDMVNDLLDLSRLEAGRMRYDMQRCDLRDCIIAVRETMQPLLEAKALTLAMDVRAADCHVNGDSARLGQALLNLVDNAIRHSPAGGRIDIVLADAILSTPEYAEEHPALLLSVADAGSGIPEEELDVIFDNFTQGSHAQAGGGSGLGLAICREIVLAHHGLIRARNRAQGGAVFEVLLPRKEGEA